MSMTRNLKSLDKKKSQAYLGASGYDLIYSGISFPFEGPDNVSVNTAQGPEPCHSSRIQHIQAFFKQKADEYKGFAGTEEEWRRRWLSPIPKM